MKKTLLILIIILIGLGAFWFFYIKPKTNEGTTTMDVVGNLFPIGNSIGDIFSNGDENLFINDPNTVLNQNNTTNFKQVTNFPIAGYTTFNLTREVIVNNTENPNQPTRTNITDNILRYVSRETGYVFEKKNDDQGIQITNIHIPNIYEASFADNNNTAILRFLRPDNRTIATYSVPIPIADASGRKTQQNGVFLSDNIQSIATAKNSSTILELIKTQTGSTISSSSTNNTNKRTVTNQTFSEWLLIWPNPQNIYLQTKASSNVAGFLYRLEQNGRLNKIIGNVSGLTASVSPKNNFIIYSNSVEGGIVTKLFNMSNNTTTTMSLSILPEKCVWLENEDLICAGNTFMPNDGVYPDSWYAGITKLNDQLYRINTSTNTYTLLYNGSDRVFDMINLQMDEGRGILYFIDKPTGLLWQFSV